MSSHELGVAIGPFMGWDGYVNGSWAGDELHHVEVWLGTFGPRGGPRPRFRGTPDEARRLAFALESLAAAAEAKVEQLEEERRESR